MLLNLNKKLLHRQRNGNLRLLKNNCAPIDFSSNDYLGLSKSSAFSKPSFFPSFGSTGSRLLTGNSRFIEDLEKQIAAFHGYEAGLIFNCGYMANVGLLSAITTDQDTILYDIFIHASMIDGIRLSKAYAKPFRHNDLKDLEKRLMAYSKLGSCFVCIESIYSTDGSIAPLMAISQLVKKYGAHLIVDEAHAVGIHGLFGKGLVFENRLTHDVFAQVVTFGKALGTFGAIILGSAFLKNILINFANSYIYTTALPFPVLDAIKTSYDAFPFMDKERNHLQNLIKIFKENYPSVSSTVIQPLFVKGNEAAKNLAKNLQDHGFDVRALLSPTVQRGQETLRICLHAFNSESEVINLINTFKGLHS